MNYLMRKIQLGLFVVATTMKLITKWFTELMEYSKDRSGFL